MARDCSRKPSIHSRALRGIVDIPRILRSRSYPLQPSWLQLSTGQMGAHAIMALALPHRTFEYDLVGRVPAALSPGNLDGCKVR